LFTYKERTMPTMKPINVTWTLKPAGKGMSIIQSEPLPTDEAELRMSDLDKAEAPEDEGDDGMKIEIEGMGMGGKPGGMPAFGKKPAMQGAPAMAPMGAMARPGRGAPMGKPSMPPFGGM
jgi:hypothetical protein